jgi:ribosome biogenesis GTPase
MVGALSDKIKRGRHTTRHSEIMRLGTDTYVVDTPGFSSLQFEDLPARDIVSLMPDLAAYTGHCRFSSCLHRSEPGCSVKAALDAGYIQPARYETYCKIVNSILERKR